MAEVKKGDLYLDVTKQLYLVVISSRDTGINFRSHENHRLHRVSLRGLEPLAQGMLNVHDCFKVPLRRVINSMR